MISQQPFDYYCVLDFEATCDQGRSLQPPEIIEFPGILLAGDSLEPVDEFRAYVRPQHHPDLTAFCTELTGISQDKIDTASSFRTVLEEHLAWLRNHNLVVNTGDGGHSFSYVICGDWDLKEMFPSQCKSAYPQIQHIPYCFRTWVNIKRHFEIFTCKKKAPGMAGMLKALALPLQGHHHCGIDDCRNIAQIAQCLSMQGIVLTSTSELPLGRFPPLTLRLQSESDIRTVELEKRCLSSLLALACATFKRHIEQITRNRRALTDADVLELEPNSLIWLR